jgi:hypothetical protein
LISKIEEALCSIRFCWMVRLGAQFPCKFGWWIPSNRKS